MQDAEFMGLFRILRLNALIEWPLQCSSWDPLITGAVMANPIFAQFSVLPIPINNSIHIGP